MRSVRVRIVVRKVGRVLHVLHVLSDTEVNEQVELLPLTMH
jgi:hypothetical protein